MQGDKRRLDGLVNAMISSMGVIHMWKWRIYLPHQYPQVEAWLADMASDGWRLVEHRRFRFRFERCEPRTRRFRFMFGLSRGDIHAVSRDMKSRCHAMEIPHGRFTSSVLLVLPAPEKAPDEPTLLAERRREHGKHFLMTGVMWLVIGAALLLNVHPALLCAVLCLPCVLLTGLNWYALSVEVRKQ